MSSESSPFIVSAQEEERVNRHELSPKKLILKELEDDYLHYFSERGKKIAQQFFEGESLRPSERAVFDHERDEWWLNKYGFSFENAKERDEVIGRKYMVAEGLVRHRALQSELFEAVNNNNPKKIDELRRVYEEEFPDQLEGVTVLTQLPEYIHLSNIIRSLPSGPMGSREQKEKSNAYVALTQYHFLISHFVEQNSDDKWFLEEFWNVLERLGATAGNLRQAQIMRSGVLSQVAAYKIFDQLGQHPHLSHPIVDAFDAIDMTADGDTAIQVKTGHRNSDAMLMSTDEISFPGIETIEENGDTRIINTDLMRDISKFRVKSAAYAERVGTKVSAYYAVIPKQTFDHVTGEPSREIVEHFGNLLKGETPDVFRPAPKFAQVPKDSSRPMFTLGKPVPSSPTDHNTKRNGGGLRTPWGKR